MKPAKKIFLFLFASVLLTGILSACSTYSLNIKDDLSLGSQEVLPPSTPLQEVKAQYQYRYYPGTQVYFSINWGKYYYLADGLWKESYNLPSKTKLNTDNYVTLSMDVEKPYKSHKDVIKKYPSGWIKNNTQPSATNHKAIN